MKIARLQRVLRMVSILQSGRYFSPSELAERLSVTRRTVFRDLDMLRKAGIPYFHDEDRGGYKIDDSFFLPPLNLKLQEALALLLMTQHAGCSLPLRRQTQEAALKIESALPAHVQHHCGSLLRSSSISCPGQTLSEEQGEWFVLLQQAMRQQRKVEIEYASFFEKKAISTTLSPHHLHFAQRGWYVIGHSSLHEEMRTFKVSRIRKLTMSSCCYVQDKPFRIDEYLGNAWMLMPGDETYHVKLLFSQMVAGNVAEVLWHHTQRVTRHEDGKLTFEADVAGLDEISWWVLGYGDQVEVLAPEALRSQVAKIAGNLITMYQGGGEGSREVEGSGDKRAQTVKAEEQSSQVVQIEPEGHRTKGEEVT